MTLTDQGYMGLGIYMGFKSAYRRDEMRTYGVNYDEVVAELTKYGIIKSGRIVKANAQKAWDERFKGVFTSQTHHYCDALGFKRVSYY